MAGADEDVEMAQIPVALSIGSAPSESLDLEKAAEFLARSTSKSTVVFRRYDKLALGNLLHLNEKLYDMEVAFWSKTQGTQDQAPVGETQIQGTQDQAPVGETQIQGSNSTQITQDQCHDRPDPGELAKTIKDYCEYHDIHATFRCQDGPDLTRCR